MGTGQCNVIATDAGRVVCRFAIARLQSGALEAYSNWQVSKAMGASSGVPCAPPAVSCCRVIGCVRITSIVGSSAVAGPCGLELEVIRGCAGGWWQGPRSQWRPAHIKYTVPRPPRAVLIQLFLLGIVSSLGTAGDKTRHHGERNGSHQPSGGHDGEFLQPLSLRGGQI